MSILLRILATLVLSLVGIVYAAWTIQTLWEWFMIPEWAEVPKTSTVYGILLMLALVRSYNVVMSVSEWEEDVEQTVQRALDSAVAGLITITVFLAFGGILSWTL